MRTRSTECKQHWLSAEDSACMLNVNNADYVDYVLGYSSKWQLGENKCWINYVSIVFFAHKNILKASSNYGWTPDVTWTILPMSLLRFCALIMVISLLSMERWELRFHQQYLYFCSDELRIFIFGWTNPLKTDLLWALRLLIDCIWICWTYLYALFYLIF